VKGVVAFFFSASIALRRGGVDHVQSGRGGESVAIPQHGGFAGGRGKFQHHVHVLGRRGATF